MQKTKNISVLLVDDDADLMQYWVAQLERNFNRVYHAGHAYEALEVLHRKHPDIVLSDVELPEMDGVTFCQELKQHSSFQNIPVILYKSGYLTLEDKRQGAKSGAERIVCKPSTVKEVILLIEDAYASSQMHKLVGQDNYATSTEPSELPERSDGGYADYLTKQLGDTINRLKKEQQALSIALNRFKDFAECGADFFWETDFDVRLRFVSSGPDNPLFLPTGNFENRPFAVFFQNYFSTEGLRELEAHFARGAAFDMTCELNQEKDLRIVRVIGQPYFLPTGGYAGFRGTIADITDAQMNSEKLYFAAHHDALTGLLNVRAFESMLKSSMQSLQEDEQHILCYLDLDFFKEVNDTAGHRAGDELLMQLSDLFRKKVRSNDVLARIGGDEFAILLRHCGMDQARRLVQELHNSIKTFRFFWENKTFELGLSIGLVEVNHSSLTVEEVLDFADQACYAAKRAGRNQIHVFGDEDISGKLAGDALWLERFHNAINEDGLCLFAQPIKRLNREGSPSAYEILVRMQSDDKLIGPDDFLPVVYRYQLANILDLWVVNRVIEWLESVSEEGISGEFYSVNISADSLCDTDFKSHVHARLQNHPEIAQRICFEITESTAMENLDNAMRFIDDMHRLGCRFALDDFGTGFSSLAHLKNLPVDYVKLDGLFVRGITEDPVDYGLVKSIQNIAGMMNIKTIAEYVESDEIEAKLREIGVDYLQGFHIGYPEVLDMARREVSTAG
ncbi:MAG TPA: EAL domain-containing protein [Gammaproteobacteria bacterium]|nr:EAL domain-containing protein [Gammaproteobacteria bacterium]